MTILHHLYLVNRIRKILYPLYLPSDNCIYKPPVIVYDENGKLFRMRSADIFVSFATLPILSSFPILKMCRRLWTLICPLITSDITTANI